MSSGDSGGVGSSGGSGGGKRSNKISSLVMVPYEEWYYNAKEYTKLSNDDKFYLKNERDKKTQKGDGMSAKRQKLTNEVEIIISILAIIINKHG